MKNKQYVYLLLFICAVLLVLFFFLFRQDPTFLSSMPLIGKFFPTIATTTKAMSNSTNNAKTLQSQYAVGSGKVSSTVIPVSGKQLTPTGAYADGSYTGVGNLPTGSIVLTVNIRQNTIIAITLQSTPTDALASVLQSLINEALQNQIVEVSPINGYDDISIAFKNALASAVQEAFNVNKTKQ